MAADGFSAGTDYLLASSTGNTSSPTPQILRTTAMPGLRPFSATGTQLASSLLAGCHERKDHTMSGAAAAYLVAISAMLFSALSALTLINAVKHLDPPAGPPSATQVAVHKKAAV
jgi:hypothetical protein